MSCKKLLKGLAITGGVLVAIEAIGVVGEAQALAAMNETHPEAVNDVLSAINDEELLKELPVFRRAKAKAVVWTTERAIEGFRILNGYRRL